MPNAIYNFHIHGFTEIETVNIHCTNIYAALFFWFLTPVFNKAQSCFDIKVMKNTQNYNKGSNSNGRLNELLHTLPISLLFDIANHFKKKNQIFQCSNPSK